MREKQVLAEKRGASTTGGAGGTTGGAAGASVAGGAAGGDEADGEAGESGSSSSGQGEGGATVGGSESAESGPQGEETGEDEDSSRVPSDIPDSRGDDVVARQLREAAMSEPDPELREKLWDEYRRYKGISVKKANTPKEKNDDTEAKEGGGESSTG